MAAALPAFHITLLKDIVQIDALPEMKMIDHQQSAGFQPADVEAGTGAVNMAFTSGSPGAPAVAGETLSDSIKGSHQHPKGSVFLFHNHVLVDVYKRQAPPCTRSWPT